MNPLTKNDEFWMSIALGQARRGLGQVAPNPSVGCVVVKHGRLIANGYTQKGGRPHAETIALEKAGDEAKNADIYITLEPCAHLGQTPSCADSLIKAGVKKIICAMKDPDDKTNGKGFDKLKRANIEIVQGVLEEEAAFINQGYLLHRVKQRPLVSLKMGVSLDGKIASSTGHSRWITGALARRQAHILRSFYDGVLIGARTALGDNPHLTCRLPGLSQRTPIRIIADSHLSTDLASHLVVAAKEHPIWVLCREDCDPIRRQAFLDSGVKLLNIAIDEDSGLMDIDLALQSLAREGVTRLLVEGGAHLSASFLRAKKIDRIYWFTAPLMIGGDGVSAVSGMGFDKLDDMPSFRPLWTQNFQNDRLIVLARSETPHNHAL